MLNPYILAFGLISIGSIVWLFIVLVFTIIRAVKDKKNAYLSMFFICSILTLFFNIYAFTIDIANEKTFYLLLMRGSGAFFVMGIAFSLVYLANIKTIFDIQSKLSDSPRFLIIVAVLMIIYTFLGGGDLGPNLEPTYPIGTTIYIFTIYLALVGVYINQSVQIRQLCRDESMQKKIDKIILGILLIVLIFLMVLLANSQLIPLEFLMVFFSTASILSSILLIKGFSF